MSLSIDFNNGVVQMTPVAAAAGADIGSRILGLSLPEWFYVTAILYGAIQAGLAVYRTLKDETRKDKGVPPNV